MRAIVCTRYGPPEGLHLQEVETPTPKESEVRVRVRTATVTRGDAILRSLPFLLWLPMRLMLGLRRRRIPGTEFAGEVDLVGQHVRRFQEGDAVFGTTTGLPAGSYAEYVCVPEMPEQAVVEPKPANITYEEAATVPVGGTTALHFLRGADVQSGQRVLIYGASGSVGTFAVQLAKCFGAGVTGVCSTANVELVKSLGADRVIDYRREDFRAAGELYDVIFDAVGKMPLSDCRDALGAEGTYVTVSKGLARESAEDIVFLRELLEAGDIRPVIDRRYPLEQAAEAHRYVEAGHKKGNVVLTIGDE